MNIQENTLPSCAEIPMQWVGPIKIIGEEVTDQLSVPLATYESPLWPSTARGARVTLLAGGIHTTIIDERMSRSIVLTATNATECAEIVRDLKQNFTSLAEIAAATSRFISLLDLHSQIVGNLLYLRFEFSTGDAAGHNMVTQAADYLMHYIQKRHLNLSYVSISANYCIDKKVSAVNGILGRGKYVVAEVVIPAKLCRRYLKTTPAQVVDINIKKNLIGSTLAGSIRSANAHFANILLGFYLATGQDAANIIEGSQGIVHTELQGDALYFSITLPNIIVGTVGNGKNLHFVQKNLEALGCLTSRQPGHNARRLAIIIAATVLCGELSLLAAQTNPGELMASHLRLERAIQ